MVGIEFGWFALVALFVLAAPIKQRFDAVSHRIGRATGAVLIAFGFRIAFSRASG